MADLSEVPLGDLMKELQRRLECTTKSKKHLILIGMKERCHLPSGYVIGSMISSAQQGSSKHDFLSPYFEGVQAALCFLYAPLMAPAAAHRTTRLWQGHSVASYQK